MPAPKYKSVLLIDDSEIDNIILNKHLHDIAFAETVVIKDSAANALSFLEEQIRLNKVPEIIFLDIRMPEMDGFEFLSEYAKFDIKIKAKTKIVMLSSTLDYNDVSKALNNKDVFKFMHKPVQKEELKKI